MTNDGPRREGFVSPDEPDDDEIDLAAPEGTPEYERAQEEVMIRGAAAAGTEVEGDAALADDELVTEE